MKKPKFQLKKIVSLAIVAAFILSFGVTYFAVQSGPARPDQLIGVWVVPLDAPGDAVTGSFTDSGAVTLLCNANAADGHGLVNKASPAFTGLRVDPTINNLNITSYGVSVGYTTDKPYVKAVSIFQKSGGAQYADTANAVTRAVSDGATVTVAADKSSRLQLTVVITLKKM